MYFLGHDRSPARLGIAEAAVEAASRLVPDTGETRLARAENLYWGYLNYDRALAELEVAAKTLPNDPRVFELEGYIQRRQGRWDEAMRNLERAADLDPRNVFTLEQLALTYQLLRRYAGAESVLDRILTIEPNNLEIQAARAFVELDWKADTRPLHELIDKIRATNPAATQSIENYWLFCALAERDVTGAKDALIASGENPITLAQRKCRSQSSLCGRCRYSDDWRRSQRAVRVHRWAGGAGENHPSPTKLRSRTVRACFNRRRSWAKRRSASRRPAGS